MVRQIKFLDMSDLSGPGWQTFPPNEPAADITLNLSPRNGTNVSPLEIMIDQCGGSVPGSSMVKIRPPTSDYSWCRDSMSFIYVKRGRKTFRQIE